MAREDDIDVLAKALSDSMLDADLDSDDCRWEDLHEDGREYYRQRIKDLLLHEEVLLRLAPERSRDELREVLSELVDLMQGVIDGDYKPDSFTLQPARALLAAQQKETP